MSRTDNEQRVLSQFSATREMAISIAGRFVEDVEAVVQDAEAIFREMIPGMAYVDEPDHPMASAVIGCSGSLALFLVLRERGVDVHEYGAALLEEIRRNPPQEPDWENDKAAAKEQFAALMASGKASLSESRPGEFVFEVFLGDRTEYDWGTNVKSCAICHAFSRYDAMNLVPYMCATDDLLSDIGEQGLRRTGTIALGSHQCDFRYKAGGEPLRLVEQYPERIRSLGK